MSFLMVCDERFDVDWVRKQFVPNSTMSAYQAETLGFCHKWLRGDETFTLQTSGSTGNPKQIMVHREQMVASARGTAEALSLTPSDHAFISINTAYIGGMMMLVRALEIGMNATIIEPTRNPLSSFIPHHSSFLALVPMQVQATLDVPDERERLAQCRAVLIGGAPISAALESHCLRLDEVHFYHTYGMTETVSHVALRPLGTPYFVPLPDVQLGVDSRDCLTISCAMTRGKMIVTNDVVDLRPDRSFKWLGRFDNVINSGGVKIHAEKVERELAKFFPDKRLLVVGVPDDLLGERVVAIVEDARRESCQLQGKVGNLTRYEIPKQLITVEKMCETASGKIDRQATLAACRNTIHRVSMGTN